MIDTDHEPALVVRRPLDGPPCGASHRRTGEVEEHDLDRATGDVIGRLASSEAPLAEDRLAVLAEVRLLGDVAVAVARALDAGVAALHQGRVAVDVEVTLLHDEPTLVALQATTRIRRLERDRRAGRIEIGLDDQIVVLVVGPALDGEALVAHRWLAVGAEVGDLDAVAQAVVLVALRRDSVHGRDGVIGGIEVRLGELKITLVEYPADDRSSAPP